MSAPSASVSTKCVFSVDVEDWFHILDIPNAPNMAKWNQLPSRVENNFLRLLELFDRRGTKVTCFFLGWIAEKFPRLVKEAMQQGHEIASHGYAHQLAYQMTPESFHEDALRSKQILQDISGREIWGYRSAGFSVTRGNEWFFEKLIEAGYIYDSSVFPASRGHGGIAGGDRSPHRVKSPAGSLFEFPLTVTDVFGIPTCFFGGGYLRLFPYSVIRRMARKASKETNPVIFYVHPREIDPAHPRLAMSWKRRFKSYVNLKSTLPKIERLLSEYPMTSFEGIIREDMPDVLTRMEILSAQGDFTSRKAVTSQVQLKTETASEI
jgi:polysaccharide deacetylase family protein (PEP-CTERM system associated)